MTGTFQISCNFCGAQYNVYGADPPARMPPADTVVCASVSLCPVCVDSPARIRQVRERVVARLRSSRKPA